MVNETRPPTNALWSSPRDSVLMIFSASASFGAVWPLGFGFFGLFGGAFAPPNKPFFTFRLIQDTRLHTSQRVDIGEQVGRGDGKGRLDVHALQPNAERPPQS